MFLMMEILYLFLFFFLYQEEYRMAQQCIIILYLFIFLREALDSQQHSSHFQILIAVN